MKKQTSIPSPSVSEFIVCSGAQCTCTGNPSLFPELRISTHKKYYANAVDKLIATIEDTQFVDGPSPFKTCKHKKGYDKSCLYQPLGFWKVEANVDFPSIGERDILTETGTLQCIMGGTISIHHHGQVITVEEDHEQQETGTVEEEKTGVDLIEEKTGEASSPQTLRYVSNVDSITLVNLDELHWGALTPENPRALRVGLGEEMIFRASTPLGEDKQYISWSVIQSCGDSSLFEVGKTGQTFHVQTTAESVDYQAHPTTHRAFSWEPTQTGVYLISAARTPKEEAAKTYYGTFYYYIEVVNQAVLTLLELNQPPTSTRVVGDQVKITLHSTIRLSQERVDQLRIKVRVKEGDSHTQTAVVFCSTGKHQFTQVGTVIQAVYTCTNAHTYQVEVWENSKRSLAIPPQYFQVNANAVLSISPQVERIRLGSRITFTADLQNKQTITPTQVKWLIRSPGSKQFQQHFIRHTTVTLDFTVEGTYVIACVYGNFWTGKDKVTQTIQVMANQLEQLTLSPSHASSTSVQKTQKQVYQVYRQAIVTLTLETTLGYQSPTADVYVEAQELHQPNVFQRLLHYVFPEKENQPASIIHANVDGEIRYTLTYVKGPKKQTGFDLSMYYVNPKRQQAIQRDLKELEATESADTLANQPLEAIEIYPIHTQTEGIVLQSNLATLDLQLEEVGLYHLEVLFNNQTYTCEIDCTEGKVNRWEFVNALDQHQPTLSFNEDFAIALEIKGFEDQSATICYWYDSRNRERDLLELFRDTVDFDSQGKGTHVVKSFSDFWKTFARQAPEGKGEEYAIFFTLSEEIGLSNVKRELFEKKEALFGHVFPVDTVNTYAYILKKYRIEAYFNTANHRRLIRPILYKEPIELEVVRILGRYDQDEILPDTLTVTLYENTNQSFLKLEFKDRKATSFSLTFPKGQHTIYHPLDTGDELIYKGNTHKKDKELASTPRVFYLGISYEAKTKGPLYNQNPYTVKKTAVEVLFPKGYERNRANDHLLIQPFQPEIEEGLPRTEAQKRAKENLLRLATYHKDNKLGYLYLHQLKLVEKFVFNQTFKEHSIPIVVERRPKDKKEVVPDSHSDCPRCKAPVTSAQLLQIFPGSDAAILEAIAKAYTDYMTVFEMNTCWNKAHFFSQVFAESGSPLKIRKENLDYSALLLETGNERRKGNTWVKGDTVNQIGGYYTDGNYRSQPVRLNNFFQNKQHSNKYGRKDLNAPNDSGIQAANQRMIADLVYGGRFGNDKNKPGGEGWKFRGRGYIQITFRASYEQANKYTTKLLGVEVLTEEGADKVGTDPQVAMVASMAYWAWRDKKANHYSNLEWNVDEVSKKIGNNVAYAEKEKVFQDKTSKVFQIDTCDFTYFPDYGDGVLEMMKRYAEKGNKYKQDNNRTSLKYKDIVEVDCSEFVCIYLHLLGVTKQVAHVITSGMITEEIFRKNLTSTINEQCTVDFVSGKNPDFEPLPGDIFVWSTSTRGHCGIVYKYNKEKKIVTILEALGESTDMNTHLDNKFPYLNKNDKNRIKELGIDNNHTRVSYYLLKGKALQGHVGWIGYYRPRGYVKKLK